MIVKFKKNNYSKGSLALLLLSTIALVGLTDSSEPKKELKADEQKKEDGKAEVKNATGATRDFKAECEAAIRNKSKNALSDIVSAWVKADPKAAADWAEKLPNGSAYKFKALTVVAEAWGRTDLKAAADWAMKLPEDNGKDSALLGVASGWALNDPKSAAEWALELPQGNGRDMALLLIASFWSQKKLRRQRNGRSRRNE